MKAKTLVLCIAVVFLVGVAVFQYYHFAQGKLVVVFCNVGQGDGIYIRTPGGVDVLVDAGPDSSILSCLSSHMPFWDKTIELAFATHPDADHIGGYRYVLQSYTVKSYNTVDLVKDTGQFKVISDLLERQHVPVRYLIKGDTYVLDHGISLKTYWPTPEFLKLKESNTNRYSLVQMLNFNTFNVLLTGDIEFDILEKIFERHIFIDIFKLPHHGSRTGVSSHTLFSIYPKLSIISAGLHNRYGHPHHEVLQELQKHNVPYLETKSGDIEVITDGKTWQVRQ